MRDLRHYAKQTHLRLILGGLLVIFIVGEILIYLDYGENAAYMGLVCMVAGISPLVLIGLILLGIEWIVQRYNNK
jgi:hypothetical protein